MNVIIKLILCSILWVSVGHSQPASEISDIFAKASPAVVSVTAALSTEQPLLSKEQREAINHSPLMESLRQIYGDKLEDILAGRKPVFASGTIISADGYVVTNYHVVENAQKVYVLLQDRREILANVVGMDSQTDIALLKIKGENFPFLTFSDSNLVRAGDWVLAIGSPYGFESTVTTGVISGVGRSVEGERYVPYIQTDVAINPGNSGGPLLNINGEMIGINSEILSDSGGYAGISFAIPSNLVKSVITQLKEKGTVTRGVLGVAFQEMTFELASAFGLENLKGALISSIYAGGPAEKAGLKVGDVIVSFNGVDILRATDLPPLVGMIPLNSELSVKYIRDKKLLQTKILLSETVLPEPNTIKENNGTLVLRDLASFEQERVGKGKGGVFVMAVLGESWRAGGIHPDDVILAINGHEIRNSAEFRNLIKKYPKKALIAVLVQRSGESQHYYTVKLDE